MRDSSTSRHRWVTLDHKSTRQRIVAGAWLVLVLGILSTLCVKDPRTLGFGELCPSRRLFDVACPGCGSTRATHDLLHGELASAFRMNPALVLVGVPIGAWWVGGLVWAVARGIALRLAIPPRVGYAAAIALIGYMVLRNVPLESLEWLRPPRVPPS